MDNNSNSFIACCFHPTTLLLVDDDKRFLDFIMLKLNRRKFPCISRTDPRDVIKFYTEQYPYTPFTKRCISRPEDPTRGHRNIDVNLSAVSQEIFNPNRFKEIAVAVIDYAMPGLENPKALYQYLKSQGVKVILLTGEADEKIALQLFNEGIIDQFIRKDAPNFMEALLKAIEELQETYFKGLSKIIIDSLTQDPESLPSCLNDLVFINFFQEFIKQHDFIEYYLIEPSGSFLFLDENAKPSWLLVKDEDEMKGALFDAETSDTDAPHHVIELLTKREKLLHRFMKEDYYKPPTEWDSLMYPASKIDGKTTYYYSFINNLPFYPFDITKILSFRQYLEEL